MLDVCPPDPRATRSGAGGGLRGGWETPGGSGGRKGEDGSGARAPVRRAESKEDSGGGMGLRVEGGSEVLTFG